MSPPPAPVVRPLLRLALPFAVGGTLHVASLIVDRFWVGRVGTDALAALGTAHAVLFIFITIFMGLAVGTLSGVAQAIGAGRDRDAGLYAAQGAGLAVALGLATAVVATWLPAWAMDAMRTPGAVVEPATQYLAITMAGLVVHGPLYVVTFALQGAGEARASLWVAAAAPVLNALIDPLFIFVFDWGVAGAAWATVVGNLIALGIGAVILGRGRTRVHVRRSDLRPSPVILGHIIGVGAPGAMEHAVRNVARALLVAIISPFGPAVLSAYTAGTVILMLVVTPGLAIGQATATLVGQALGAQRPHLAWQTAWAGTAVYLALMVVVGALMMWQAPAMVAAFDRAPEVIAEGSMMLRTLVTCFPFVAVALVLSKSFGGAGRTMPAMVSAAISHLVVQIPLVYLLAMRYGSPGAYAGMAGAFMVQGVLSCVLFVRRFRPRVTAPVGV